MKLYSVKDSEFKPYGRIIDGYDFNGLISVLKDSTLCPDDGTVYVTSDKNLESLNAAKFLTKYLRTYADTDWLLQRA